MFYIIGVAHRVQCKQKDAADSEDQKKFRHCLADITVRSKPVVVAEECSQHTLKQLEKDNGAEYESVTKAVADSLDVKHRYCDPEPEARAKIGYREGTEIALHIAMHNTENLSNAEVNDRGFAIEVAKYWPVREKFWLDQLDDVKHRDLVFVCGDAHIDSFRELLKRNHIDSTVVAQHVGVTPSDDDWWNRTRKYLEVHPELRDQPIDSLI
jgi:hypothetical protein